MITALKKYERPLKCQGLFFWRELRNQLIFAPSNKAKAFGVVKNIGM